MLLNSSLSFRHKILIAMLMVVLILTAGSLFVSHQRMQKIFDQMIEEVFSNQLHNYYAKQEVRNRFVKNQAERLTNSVRLFAALEEGEGELVYQTAFDELRDFRSEFEFFRILDKNGFPIYDSTESSGMNHTHFETQLDKQLENQAGSFRESQKRQLNGFVDYETGNGERVLFELIITKIYDFEGVEAIGALVLGFKADLTTAAGQQLISSGILLRDIIYSDAIAKHAHNDVLKLLKSLKPSQNQFNLERAMIAKEPYRVRAALLNISQGFESAYQVTLFSLSKFEKQQSGLRNSLLLIGITGFLIAVLLCLYLSRGLVKPILNLLQGTRKITEGNYEVSVPVTTRDEIGELSSAFNEMTEGLALKEKYHNVLQAVTDKKVADALTHGELKLGGEVRTVSVLFCDIRGFTALTEGMAPAEVVNMLNEHMTALTEAVINHNGIVDKFVGDLIMAIFGAPQSYEQDAYDAVQCAIEMLKKREKINLTSKHQIEVGIGIATGEVLAGCMGSDSRLNYTVLGEYVNLASRLCSEAGGGEIIIDENTSRVIGEKITSEPKEKLFLKGFSSPVQAYTLKPEKTKS